MPPRPGWWETESSFCPAALSNAGCLLVHSAAAPLSSIPRLCPRWNRTWWNSVHPVLSATLGSPAWLRLCADEETSSTGQREEYCGRRWDLASNASSDDKTKIDSALPSLWFTAFTFGCYSQSVISWEAAQEIHHVTPFSQKNDSSLLTRLFFFVLSSLNLFHLSFPTPSAPDATFL